MSAIVFLDTETTGLTDQDEIWEFAAIRREAGKPDEHLSFFIEHYLERAKQLPPKFREDHDNRYKFDGWANSKVDSVDLIHNILRDRAHIVGAVPSFDTGFLTRLYAEVGREPNWHYHLIDVENLVVGYLAAKWGKPVEPPYNSNDLSLCVGVNPDDFERHTAMGDVLWAKAIYDQVMNGDSND